MTGNKIEIKNDLEIAFNGISDAMQKIESQAWHAASAIVCAAFLSVRFDRAVVFEEALLMSDGVWQKRYAVLRMASANHATHDVARGCYKDAVKTIKGYFSPVAESDWMLVGLFMETIFLHAFSEQALTWEDCQKDLQRAYESFLKIINVKQHE